MKKIRIGTRGSALALAQARLAAAAFERAGFAAEIVPVRTRGDADVHASLAELGRGAFTDVFSEMIGRGEIDVAVHSAKDLPAGEEKHGFFCLPRGNARDVFVYLKNEEIRRVGTGSPRRAAAAKALCPQAQILHVRGNVDTRLKKLFAGEFDALVLAAAGLERLGLIDARGAFCDPRAGVRPFLPEECVPAACQGIIAVEGGAGALIDDRETSLAARTERKLQRALGGDCSGGLGAYFDGRMLYAQKEGKICFLPYAGEESVAALAGKLS